MEKIESNIKNIISEQLGIELENISNNFYIKGDLGADSLDIIELIMSIEEKFDLQIPDDKIRKIATVEDIINYVKQCKK